MHESESHRRRQGTHKRDKVSQKGDIRRTKLNSAAVADDCL